MFSRVLRIKTKLSYLFKKNWFKNCACVKMKKSLETNQVAWAARLIKFPFISQIQKVPERGHQLLMSLVSRVYTLQLPYICRFMFAVSISGVTDPLMYCKKRRTVSAHYCGCTKKHFRSTEKDFISKLYYKSLFYLMHLQLNGAFSWEPVAWLLLAQGFDKWTNM